MLKPSLADLRAFVTVGELQSFAAAAKALHLSQPALSRRISHLEDLLGVRLFDRTTRNVALTALGERFLGEVRGLVEDMDRSVLSLRDAAELEAGDVTIGCVFSAVHHFLPPVIRAFRERHPRVLVRIIEEGADEVLASVKHGEADLAVNYIGMQDPEVEFTPLLKEPYVLACPAGSPAGPAPIGALGGARELSARPGLACLAQPPLHRPGAGRAAAAAATDHRGAARVDADRPGRERPRRWRWCRD